MTIKERIKAQLVLYTVARKNGRNSAEIRQDMQEAIDAAWSAGEPAAMAEIRRWFPAGKPTVEEFLTRTARQLRSS